jgi:hypothetical protein
MAIKRLPRPRDPLQLGKLIGDILTGQVNDEVDDGKNAAAVELGRKGGLRGGKARAQKLSSAERKKSAKHAAEQRWAARTTQK